MDFAARRGRHIVAKFNAVEDDRKADLFYQGCKY